MLLAILSQSDTDQVRQAMIEELAVCLETLSLTLSNKKGKYMYIFSKLLNFGQQTKRSDQLIIALAAFVVCNYPAIRYINRFSDQLARCIQEPKGPRNLKYDAYCQFCNKIKIIGTI